jgi:hypothetical protein
VDLWLGLLPEERLWTAVPLREVALAVVRRAVPFAAEAEVECKAAFEVPCAPALLPA